MGRQRFRYDFRMEDLARLRAAGYGRIAIAKLYGCDPSTVRYWLIKFGLPPEQFRARPSAKKIEDMIKMGPETRHKRKAELSDWPIDMKFEDSQEALRHQ